MAQNLLVVHRQGETLDLNQAFPNALVWKTCLRQIALFPKENFQTSKLKPGDQTFQSDEAYQFLLEVACSLHSPLTGETEVLGQLREFFSNLPEDEFGTYLKKLSGTLLAHAKAVRSEHLYGLGSQSYGSLVRRHLKGITEISILGAGQLVREMLPWLVDEAKVRIYCRNPEKAKDLKEKYPTIEILKYEQVNSSRGPQTALVIAAPIASKEIEMWAGLQVPPFLKVIDLRGEAATDPLKLKGEIFLLPELFAQLESFRQSIAGKVEAAKKDIERLSREHHQRMECRPFGWDDICA